MYIRTTTDPITLKEVTSLRDHPALFEGDQENGLEIHFESEATRREYIELKPHDPKILRGNESDEYVAKG
jgi:hypothetical protein